jgi:hypothetical protein
MNDKRETMTKDSIAHQGRLLRAWRFAVPGLVFSVAFGFAACTERTRSSMDPACPEPTGSGSAGASGSAGSGQSGSAGQGGAGNSGSAGANPGTGGVGATDAVSDNEDNTFDHFNDPGDPFEILKQHQEEGPSDIRGRLHSCQKIPYSALGEFLKSRGVDIANVAPKSAGQLYRDGKDTLGVANYEAREAETYFHTTAGATKLFDIFVQAAPEIIANIQNMPACQVGGQGNPMFDSATGECVFESLSCIMGRPAKVQDIKLCNAMIQHAEPGNQADLDLKRRITVAAFLSAAHTCE